MYHLRTIVIATAALLAATSAASSPTSYESDEVMSCLERSTDADRMTCLASLLEAEDQISEEAEAEAAKSRSIRPTARSQLVPVPETLTAGTSIRPTRRQYTEEQYREIDRQFVPKAKRNVLILLNTGGLVAWRDLVISSRHLPVLCGQVRVQTSQQVSSDYKRFVATPEPRLVVIDSALIGIQEIWLRLCPGIPGPTAGN